MPATFRGEISFNIQYFLSDAFDDPLDLSADPGDLTVGMPFLGCLSGKFYYEVEVIEAKGWAAVGFVDSNYRGRILGFDNHSWGIYTGGEAYNW